MNVQKLNESIETLKINMGEGLISCDIWKTATGQSIAHYGGGNAKATALFDQITNNLQRALKMANYSKIKDYYLMRLENNVLVAVVIYDEYQWGIAVDETKAQLGLFLNVALPEALGVFKEAVEE